MLSHREILAGTIGVGAGVVGLPIGSAVYDSLQTTDPEYVIVRNATESRQSVSVLFEAGGEPVFWETYDLDGGEVVEVDGLSRADSYRLLVDWNEVTHSRRLASGTRAVAIVVTTAFGGDVVVRDVPLSSLSSSREFGTQNDSSASG